MPRQDSKPKVVAVNDVVVWRDGKYTTEFKNMCLAMFLQGFTLSEIADYFQVSLPTLSLWKKNEKWEESKLAYEEEYKHRIQEAVLSEALNIAKYQRGITSIIVGKAVKLLNTLDDEESKLLLPRIAKIALDALNAQREAYAFSINLTDQIGRGKMKQPEQQPFLPKELYKEMTAVLIRFKTGESPDQIMENVTPSYKEGEAFEVDTEITSFPKQLPPSSSDPEDN